MCKIDTVLVFMLLLVGNLLCLCKPGSEVFWYCQWNISLVVLGPFWQLPARRVLQSRSNTFHGAISVGKPSPVLRRLHVARTGVGIGQWWRSEARVGHVGAGVSLLVHDRAYPSKSISTFSVLHFCAQRVSVQPQVVRALL